ncbi:hypothetical protein [Novosphingopyxis sp.]|uniref:hypothetical protein n=1 Tax=Novosphingopyxis sp. TaxID=2709690 RepID=UPI003B5A07EC
MPDLQPVFDAIRPFYARHADRGVVTDDRDGVYYIGTNEVREKDGYRTQFGGVEIKKNYVSAHLTPVYVHPDLLSDVSAGLKKHMQGKSCFNFKTVDPDQFSELGALIERGMRRFEADGRF